MQRVAAVRRSRLDNRATKPSAHGIRAAVQRQRPCLMMHAIYLIRSPRIAPGNSVTKASQDKVLPNGFRPLMPSHISHFVFAAGARRTSGRSPRRGGNLAHRGDGERARKMPARRKLSAPRAENRVRKVQIAPHQI